MSKQSKVYFARWVQQNDPFLFEVAKKRFQMKNQQMNGLGFSLSDFNIGDFASSLVDTVKSVAPALVQYKAQSKILKTQLKRAEQGLPPMDASQYTPTVKVAAEVTPEMEAAATRVAQESIKTGAAQFQQMLPWFIGLGIGGFLLMRKKSR